MPHEAAAAAGGVEEVASRGRPNATDRGGGGAMPLLPASQTGWRDEEAGVMDRQMDGDGSADSDPR